MKADDLDFTKAHSLLDIAQAAELHVDSERASPSDCEIVPGVAAEWFLVRTFAGDDLRAMRWLARRRFGVFRPMQQRCDKNSGRALAGNEAVFPGWLFVFCWMDETAYHRILKCPGVLEILSDPASGEPIAIDEPVVGEDEFGRPNVDRAGRPLSCRFPRVTFVGRLRSLAWVYDEAAPAARTHAAVQGARHEKRMTKSLPRSERRKLQRLTAAARRCGIWTEREWARANRLAPGERIRLLMRAATGLAVCTPENAP